MKSRLLCATVHEEKKSSRFLILNQQKKKRKKKTHKLYYKLHEEKKKRNIEGQERLTKHRNIEVRSQSRYKEIMRSTHTFSFVCFYMDKENLKFIIFYNEKIQVITNIITVNITKSFKVFFFFQYER